MKSSIKRFFVLFAFLILTVLFSLCSFAKVYSGQADTYNWSIDLNDGSMVISGSGEISDSANYLTVPYAKYLPLVKTLVIEEGITEIGTCAFMYASKLETVDLPEGLTRIGESAFEYCISLKEINLPHTLSSIENAAFSSCQALTKITLSDSLENLGAYAFSDCISLDTINLPTGIGELQAGVFSGCKALSQVDGINSIFSLGEGSFYNCESLDLEEFPANVTAVPDRAFFGCASLTSTVPSSVIISSGSFFNSSVSFNVVFNIDGCKNILTIPMGQIPEYSELVRKRCVLDGIYNFVSWDKALAAASTPQNEYTALFSLAKPIVSASYTNDNGTVKADAVLNLSHIGTENAYILFACYGENNTMICSKRVPVTTEDTLAHVEMLLRGRTLSQVKAYIYTDNNCFTPLGEYVVAQK